MAGESISWQETAQQLRQTRCAEAQGLGNAGEGSDGRAGWSRATDGPEQHPEELRSDSTVRGSHQQFLSRGDVFLHAAPRVPRTCQEGCEVAGLGFVVLTVTRRHVYFSHSGVTSGSELFTSVPTDFL